MKIRFSICLMTMTVTITFLMNQIALGDTVTISGQYESVWITSATHEYCVQNNVWNPDSGWVQVLEVDDQNGNFTVKEANHNKPTGGSPAAYPSIYKGNHWGSATVNSGMPIRVGSIINVSTTWNITTIDSGIWNAAYDIWFHQTSDYSGGSPNGAELMIWISWLGSIQPAGSRVANVTLEGATWEVWFADWADWDYIAYRITSKTTSVNFDINAFINDAVSRGYIQESWYLIDVEAGFELWHGGAGLKSSGFSVTASGDSVPPTIEKPSRIPEGDVEPFTDVKVLVNVTDFESEVKNVTLFYNLNESATWNDLPMTLNSTTGLYEAVILGEEAGAGTLVKYKIVAYDEAGNCQVEDNKGIYYTYTVVPELSLTIILPLLTSTTLIATILSRKRKRTK
ncbi:MAG: hypothetical protein QW270_01255 [Candidatus Bathyarchaeia archaeon]